MTEMLWNSVAQFFERNDVQVAALHLEAHLRAQKSERFSTLADLRFRNDPNDVLAYVNEFIAECSSFFNVESVYLEMNGFDINFDRWYFDLFAYTEYVSDPDDLDWLCEWSSPDWEPLTLIGMEEIQEEFRWYMENEAWRQKEHKATEEIATLLVMVRFVQLVSEALQSGPLTKPVPVLATAHDFDILARFTP